MQLRRIIGKKLIDIGLLIHGPFEEVSPEVTTPLKQALDMPLDAVVEAQDESPQWSEHQKGNVIVVEPDLISLHRRGKL